VTWQVPRHHLAHNRLAAAAAAAAAVRKMGAAALEASLWQQGVSQQQTRSVLHPCLQHERQQLLNQAKIHYDNTCACILLEQHLSVGVMDRQELTMKYALMLRI
jgi:SOS response regulatory protein OraA/RecX